MPALLQVGEEIHFEGKGEFGGCAEGEIHILTENLRDVRPRHFHPLRQFALVDAELLHPAENAAEKSGSDVVESGHF